MASLDFNTPTAICNQALNAAGLKFYLGDIEEGTEPAQVCLRTYAPCVDQLLRGAHWDFARKEAQLLLVADGTGMTPNMTTVVGAGFMYAYAYPTDCLKVRYLPGNPWNVIPPVPPNNILPPDPSAPLTSAPQAGPWVGQPVIPSRFLISSSQATVEADASNAIPYSSPIGRTVILSNVLQARGVYTYNANWPNLWDGLFRAALVSYIASEIALSLHDDKRLGIQMRDRQMAVTVAKLNEARRVNGNETWANADIAVDWMAVRNGAWRGRFGGNNWGVGPGFLYGGWDAVGFAGNTAAY